MIKRKNAKRREKKRKDSFYYFVEIFDRDLLTIFQFYVFYVPYQYKS